jgi:hypothetical protein
MLFINWLNLNGRWRFIGCAWSGQFWIPLMATDNHRVARKEQKRQTMFVVDTWSGSW